MMVRPGWGATNTSGRESTQGPCALKQKYHLPSKCAVFCAFFFKRKIVFLLSKKKFFFKKNFLNFFLLSFTSNLLSFTTFYSVLPRLALSFTKYPITAPSGVPLDTPPLPLSQPPTIAAAPTKAFRNSSMNQGSEAVASPFVLYPGPQLGVARPRYAASHPPTGGGGRGAGGGGGAEGVAYKDRAHPPPPRVLCPCVMALTETGPCTAAPHGLGHMCATVFLHNHFSGSILQKEMFSRFMARHYMIWQCQLVLHMTV